MSLISQESNLPRVLSHRVDISLVIWKLLRFIVFWPIQVKTQKLQYNIVLNFEIKNLAIFVGLDQHQLISLVLTNILPVSSKSDSV